MPIPEAIEQVGGLQTQDAPSGYVGLWTRLSDFPRAALTEALTDRFRELTGREGRAVEREREALEAFHA